MNIYTNTAPRTRGIFLPLPGTPFAAEPVDRVDLSPAAQQAVTAPAPAVSPSTASLVAAVAAAARQAASLGYLPQPYYQPQPYNPYYPGY